MVRDRAVGAGRDDEVEGQPVGPGVDEAPFELDGELAFGAAGVQPLEHGGEHLGRDGAGQPELRELAGVLDDAQALDQAGARDHGALALAGRGQQLVALVVGDVLALEAQPPRRAVQRHLDGAAADHRRDVGGLDGGAALVAGVGDQGVGVGSLPTTTCPFEPVKPVSQATLAAPVT